MDMSVFNTPAEKLKAISHPHRLCIIRGLADNACNVTKIQECLNLPQSTISQHLSKLRAAGIIEGQRNGLEICYRVVDRDVLNIIKLLFDDKSDEKFDEKQEGTKQK